MDDASDDLGPVLGAVGPRLRALRVERGTTLAQLSERTGISVSTLSRLESGGRKPTLELLLPLARAHAVALDEMVDAPQTADPRVRPEPLHRSGMTLVPPTRRPGGLQAYKAIMPPDSAGQRRTAPDSAGRQPEQRSHEGYEWLTSSPAASGCCSGPHDLLLEAGKVAEFDTRTPHWFGNPGLGTAELLSLLRPQGELMHVRARPRQST